MRYFIIEKSHYGDHHYGLINDPIVLSRRIVISRFVISRFHCIGMYCECNSWNPCRVADLSDFWRRAAMVDASDKAPQSSMNPEWLQSYNREVQDYREKSDYWRNHVSELENRDRAAEAVHQANRPGRDRMLEKEVMWRTNSGAANIAKDAAAAGQSAETGRKKNDVEVLCELIFEKGEKYEDGTAAISFHRLRRAFVRPNLIGCLVKAKKHGVVYYEGEVIMVATLDIRPCTSFKRKYISFRRISKTKSKISSFWEFRSGKFEPVSTEWGVGSSAAAKKKLLLLEPRARLNQKYNRKNRLLSMCKLITTVITWLVKLCTVRAAYGTLV